MTATPLTKPPELSYTPIEAEVLRGLTAQPKTLSPWLFYDKEGSRLFESITCLPEYYLTRVERGILAEHATEIIGAAAGGRGLTIFELGAGTAAKTGLLLKAAVEAREQVTYHAIDVSPAALAEAKSRLEAELPGVAVKPHVADYTSELGGELGAELGAAVGVGAGNGFGAGLAAGDARTANRRLVLYIGSSIGNFDPEDARALLRRVRARLSPGDRLLLGVDMIKDKQLLLAAYNDAAGVTASFNKNVLARINRELDADFNLQHFRHRAVWNERQSRIEIYLKSTAAQRVSIGALELEVDFAAGETIHTENSYKFTTQRVSRLLEEAGFELEQRWSDTKGWFGVFLAGARAGNPTSNGKS